jgi:hypothetical protein
LEGRASRAIWTRTQREEYKLKVSGRESDKETRIWSMAQQLLKISLMTDIHYGNKSGFSALHLVLQGDLFELRTGELYSSNESAPYLF